jgi:hypothetical protein
MKIIGKRRKSAFGKVTPMDVIPVVGNGYPGVSVVVWNLLEAVAP